MTENDTISNSSEKNNNARKNNVIVILLLVVLVVITTLFFIQRNDHAKILNSLNAEKDSLKLELEDIIMGYDSLKTDNDTLNSNLFKARTRVENLMTELNQVKKASYEQITKYQNEVGSLRKVMRDFVVQIDSLNHRNEILMAENQRVRREYREIEARNKELVADKQQLSQRVEQAAMLEALNLKVSAVTDKNKVTTNIKRAEKFMVSFTLSKNITAARGSKNLYVRILRPDQVLFNKSKDDLFQFEDLKIPYSAMREVTYEGNELPVNIFWDNAGEPPFMNGNYTIDIFADGNNIGSTNFSFRK